MWIVPLSLYSKVKANMTFALHVILGTSLLLNNYLITTCSYSLFYACALIVLCSWHAYIIYSIVISNNNILNKLKTFHGSHDRWIYSYAFLWLGSAVINIYVLHIIFRMYSSWWLSSSWLVCSVCMYVYLVATLIGSALFPRVLHNIASSYILMALHLWSSLHL